MGGIAAADFGWNDVGSWNAVYELLPRDAAATRSPANRSAWTRTTTSWTPAAKMVALLGVKDLIVVDTPDALLVAARTRAQQVGEFVKALEQRKREDLL